MPEENQTNDDQDENEELEVKKSSDYIEIYANNVQMGFTPWDMWLVFASMSGNQKNGLFVQERAKITMSLQHAKVFADLLRKNIASFERQTTTISQHFKPEEIIGGLLADAEKETEKK